MTRPKQKLLVIDGIEIEFERKNVKNINLRVRGDGTAAVSAPLQMPQEKVELFVHERAAWIRAAQGRTAARAAREQARPLPEKDVARTHFIALSDKVYPAFAAALGGQKPEIRVRSMKTRWGVCHVAARRITFALELYNMPPAAQIYVVVHEYCHFLVPNHSRAFWVQVEKFLPDWKARRALLRQ